MNKITRFSILHIAFLSVATVFVLATQVQTASAQHRHIGENYMGGIVFWVDVAGQHGLIIDATDLADPAGSTDLTWDAANTACTTKHGSSGTWYLPSQTQLRTLSHNRQFTGIGNTFSNGEYWSSQSYSGPSAYTILFSTHQKSGKPKTASCRARAIRSF